MDPATLAAIASTIGSVISIGSASNAERRADRYRRMALQLQRDRVNLTKAELNRINNLWGDTMTSLSQYYSGSATEYAKFLKSPLVASKIETQTANIQRAQAESLKDVNEQLATLGISPGSGESIRVGKEIGHLTAAQQSRVRAEAPMQAARELLGFAEVGEQARGQAVANLGSAQGALAGTAGTFSGRQEQIAAGANVGASITAAFDAWADRADQRKREEAADEAETLTAINYQPGETRDPNRRVVV